VPTQPAFTAQSQLPADEKGHPYHPHVDAKDDKWVGHVTCADDPHYHLDHPWEHGHYTGGFGPQQVYTLQVDKVAVPVARWLSDESGRMYFGNTYWRVSRQDYDVAAHWKWAGDQIVIYEDPVHVGWYLAYIPRIGTYAHVEYLGAGDPPELVAETPRKTFENDQVVMNEPHAKMHVHRYNRVMIYGTPGGELVHSLDGVTTVKKWDAGQVFWVPATPMHYSEIPEETDVPHGPRGLDIGIKNLAEPTEKVSATLDPLRIDPDDFKLEFDTPQVRVLRLKIAPGKTVPTVEYALNTIFWYYTDKNLRETTPDGKTDVTPHKAGDFVWQNGPRKVKMENTSDKPFEAIVVELKD
jgi:hypothetical protein